MLNKSKKFNKIIGPFLVCLFGSIVIGCGLIANHQEAVASNRRIQHISNIYKKDKAKPYMTINNIKTITDKVNDADSNQVDNVLNKLDNAIAVDNRDGHEYIVVIHIGDNTDSYTLTPKLNGKSAAINSLWQKEHQKREELV